MDNTSFSNINTIPVAENHPKTKPLTVKRLWCVGKNMVTVIDKSIVTRLGITEENTLFQQEIVEGGIFLKIVPNGSMF